MAKYKTLRNGVSIDCNILNESAGKYIVEFNNGVIKDVDKRRVYDLNELDEGVLDVAKDVARKIKNKVSSFVSGIVKKGKYIFFTDENDRIIPAVSPLALAERAKTEDGILYFRLGDDLAEFADTIGEEPDIVESEGSETTAYYDILNEAYDWKLGYKDTNHNSFITLESQGTGDDVCQEEIVKILADLLEKAHDGGMETSLIPICIWGGPGIGKTAIVKSLVKSARQEWPRLSLFAIDARTMFRSDFTNPATVDREIYDRQGNKIVVHEAIDIMKKWLPVFDADYCERTDNPDEMYAQMDDIANGGHAVLDVDGNVVWDIEPEYEIDENGKVALDEKHNPIVLKPGKAKWVEGQGGIIFMDELSRIPDEILNSFMSLLSDRSIGVTSYQLGSKWIIVGAANRKGDMSDKDKRYYESAIKQRMTSFNYVPKRGEWLMWADDTTDGAPNVLPIISAFIKSNDGAGFFYKIQKEKNVDDFINYTLATCSPRRWTQLSSYISMMLSANVKQDTGKPSWRPSFKRYHDEYEKYDLVKKVVNKAEADAQKSKNDDFSKIAKQVAKRVASTPVKYAFTATVPEEISTDIWKNWVETFCGTEAAEAFKGYFETIAKFSDKDAESVWIKGDKFKLKSNPTASDAYNIIDRVLDCNPYMSDANKFPIDALTNVLYFGKLLAERSGDSQGPSVVFATIYDKICKKFETVTGKKLASLDEYDEFVQEYQDIKANFQKNINQ